MTFQKQAWQAIHAAGGRITDQTQLLLSLLAEADDYLDVEQLHQLAMLQDPSISLPTVYRTLHRLESAKLITPRYLSSEHERKYYRIAAGEPLHFTCHRCHRVIPFHSQLIQQLRYELAAQLDVDVFSLCLCANGLCETCRKENKT